MKVKSLLFDNLTLKQTVFKNVFWLILADFFLKVPAFLLNIGIIRYLSTEDYGKFAFSFAFTSLFVIFTDLGLSTLIIREVAKDRDLANKYIGNLLSLKIILALVTMALVYVSISFFRRSPDVITLVYLATVFVTVSSFVNFIQSIFQAFEKMEYLALTRLVYSVSLPAITFLIIWQKLGLVTLSAGYVGSMIVTLIFGLALTNRRLATLRLEFNLSFWGKNLAEAWSFGLIGLLGGISFPMATTQISLIAGDRETGFYNVGYQFIFILTSLVGLLFTALFPTLSREYKNSKTNFYRLLGLFANKVVLASFIFCLALFILGPKAILLLYGQQYSNSIDLLRILTISLFVLFINTPYSEALRITGYQKEYLKSLIWGVMVGFLLNFPLIYFWGSQGAALSTIFSSTIITILILKKFKVLKRLDLTQTR